MCNETYCVRISGKAKTIYHDDFIDAVNNLAQADGDGHVLCDGIAFAAKSNGRIVFHENAPRAGRYAVVGSTIYEGSNELMGQYDCPRCAYLSGREDCHDDWHVIDLNYGARIAGFYSYYHGGGESYGDVSTCCEDCSDECL